MTSRTPYAKPVLVLVVLLIAGISYDSYRLRAVDRFIDALRGGAYADLGESDCVLPANVRDWLTTV